MISVAKSTSKFKVGDRVRAIGCGLDGNSATIGLTGTVIEIIRDSGSPYDITVEFDETFPGGHNGTGPVTGRDDHCYHGQASQLELIEETAKVSFEAEGEEEKIPDDIIEEKTPSKGFSVSKRVSLPIRKGKVSFVPDSEEFLDQRPLLEKISLAINMKMPVLLIGETGTGKTSLVRYLASKTNNGFRRVNHNGGTTVDEIQGKILVKADVGTYWVDGVLIDAMRQGHWYLADEINASSAEINFLYHSLLDDDGYVVLLENNGEVVRPHPDFRFFGGMNPTDTYAGTKELNKALMSRFAVFKVDYPSPKTELEILTSRTQIPAEIAKRLVVFAAEMRANHAKQKVDYAPSTRDLLMWAHLMTKMKKFIPAAEIAILNKVGVDDLGVTQDMLGMHFKSIDEGKVKTDAFDEFSK